MYFITVSNGLLEPAHRKRIGIAIWEFLWCIDRITALDENGVGVVRGGAPTKLIDIAGVLGSSESSVSRNLNRLSDCGYVRLIYAPYGIVIRVPKAKKRFGLQVHPRTVHRFSRNAQPPCRNAGPPCTSAGPNKTGIETVIEDKSPAAFPPVDNSKFKALRSDINKLAQSFRCMK